MTAPNMKFRIEKTVTFATLHQVIRDAVGDDNDAYQDVWVAIFTPGNKWHGRPPKTLDEVKQLAHTLRRHHRNNRILAEHRERSIFQVLPGTDGLTLADILEG